MLLDLGLRWEHEVEVVSLLRMDYSRYDGSCTGIQVHGEYWERLPSFLSCVSKPRKTRLLAALQRLRDDLVI
jgi:hypothetical protein